MQDEVKKKGMYGRCDFCGSDIPGISNLLMGCPSEYHNLVTPATLKKYKEVIQDVFSELDCINSALAEENTESANYHLVRAMNKIHDPRDW